MLLHHYSAQLRHWMGLLSSQCRLDYSDQVVRHHVPGAQQPQHSWRALFLGPSAVRDLGLEQVRSEVVDHHCLFLHGTGELDHLRRRHDP